MVSGARFEPVRTESTAALIARQLREAVTYGRLAPGTQLSEAQLSAQFGMSRGRLREAMHWTAQRGGVPRRIPRAEGAHATALAP